MTTKNESLWLASGQSGENQARALNQAIEFTRVEIGDANGVQPPMDGSLTALVNKVADGELLSHAVDPNDANQRIVKMSIPPNDNYNARELILYAKYGNTEFPHTYFRLADAYPVRTIENGGSQATLKWTIRVSQYTDVAIMVSPNLAYATEDFVHTNLGTVFIEGAGDAVKNGKHRFMTPAAVQLLASPDREEVRFEVDDTVDLAAGACKLLAPQGEKIKLPDGDFNDVDIKTKSVEFKLVRRNGAWKS